MPQYSEPAELTPFARVLIDYMWNRRSPTRAPMAVPQLAARLGMPRQNVYNWIYRSTVPTFEIILAVLARLDIPLRDLYDAYQRAGLAVPRWDEHDTTNATANREDPAISRSRKPTAVTIDYDDAPSPRPYIPPPLTTPEERATADYDRMIAQTQATMRDAGFPPSVIAAAVATIRAQQQSQITGIPTRMDQHILAEHSKSTPEPAAGQPEQQPEHKRQRTSPGNVGSGK